MDAPLTGRFGIEVELNSLDCRDFLSRPLARGERPDGIEKIAGIISAMGLECEVQEWQYNHNPSRWSCKPDSSCGIEICSPVFDISSKHELLDVLRALYSDPSVILDDRCSLHVHLELSSLDCTSAAASILAWWVKCEHVFIDFAAASRKNNFYCRPIGITDLFDSREEVCCESILKKLSRKHFSANSFHFFNRRRSTLEFRIGEATKDCHLADMWVQILLRFASNAINGGIPPDYLWMRPEEVLDFLAMDYCLEDWFLRRLVNNADFESSECFCSKNRLHAKNFYIRLLESRRKYHDE